MKRNTTAFLIIALAAELGTTWFQRLRTTTDVAPGLYYPSFESLLVERLFVWFICRGVGNALAHDIQTQNEGLS